MNHGDKGRERQRLERLSWVLDNLIPIPGLRARVGLDALIGLLPGVGDTLGALLSSYILAEAARLGAPKSVLLKMSFNIALDALVGAVPVVGDLFDFVWKANQRNVVLIADYLDNPRKTVVASRFFVALLVLVLIVFVALAGALGFLLIRALWVVAFGS